MLKHLKKHIGKQLRDAKLKRHHLKNHSFKKTSKKRIVMCFNGVVPHGGLVDRLKGIVSFYEVAKQLNYDFYIQFNHPFSLTEFLTPNKVEWEIDANESTYNFGSTKIINCINNFNFNPLEALKQSNKTTFLVYANIDYLRNICPQATATDLEALWRQHFHDLFALSPKLLEALKSLNENSYNSFRTRFTSLMGDFTDSTKAYLTEKEKEEFLQKLNIEVENLLKQTDKPLYAFSDSTIFLNHIINKKSVKTIEGIPFHMDCYKTSHSLESHLKTMVDFFTIANSNKVFFIKAGPMYQSAFSKYAAIVGNKPFVKIDA